MSDRIALIHNRLKSTFGPDTTVQLKDQSHLHEGHAGARAGLGHFDLTIVSLQFEGASRIQRHKMVYDSLGTLMESDIHAIRIKALTPSE